MLFVYSNIQLKEINLLYYYNQEDSGYLILCNDFYTMPTKKCYPIYT